VGFCVGLLFGVVGRVVCLLLGWPGFPLVVLEGCVLLRIQRDFSCRYTLISVSFSKSYTIQ
jgi:hypothetical protein